MPDFSAARHRFAPVLRLGWIRSLIAAELLVALAVAGGLWLLRAQTVEGELRTLASLARAMALQADRTLGVADTVLRSTRDELARRLIVPGTAEADAVLRDRTLSLDTFRALAVFDAAGTRVASSRAPGPGAPLNIGERDFFVAARSAAAPQLIVGAPYVAQSDGRAAVSVAMGWHDSDGRFRGIVSLVADPGFLEGGFDRIAPSTDTRLTVHNLDGAPLASGGDAAARAHLAPAQVQQLRLRAAGSVAEEMLAADGQPRLVAAAVLEHHPLTVVVSRNAALALAAWTDTAWLAGVFTASMLLVTLALALRIAADDLRRESGAQRLSRSNKLEALGKLAGGVAHDFNNVLAAVVGFGEMAQREAPAGSRQARWLEQVLQAGQRGKAQVERILAFSRGQPRPASSFLLQPVLAEVLDHLAASKRASVLIEPALHAPGLVVRGDATAVYEAAMNLCTNALQAMPQGGTLRVGLEAQQVERALALYDSTLAPGRYAVLTVSDSGSGMSAEVLTRLFEPFFTTKGANGGTGLGLAVVHAVVSDMQGAIDVASTPGAGTRFALYLPAVDAAAEAPAAAPADVPLGAGQAVLVVDDEPALVELAEELLGGLGYEPLGTASSAEALAALQREPQRFDLLLTDEVMPGLTGTALARAARALRPDLPIVLASGYGGSQLDARAAEAGIRVVVAKPLTRAELAQALARALVG